MREERLSSGPLRFKDPRREAMLESDEVSAMLRLNELGWGAKRIARELGVSRNTVKEYIAAGFEGDALGRNWGGIRDRCGKTSEIGTDYLGATAPVHRSQAAGGLGCAPRICTTRITCSATSVFRLPSVSSRHL